VTTSQKVSISLLITILLFGVFSILTFFGLFNLIEADFYNPSITAYLIRDNTQKAEAIERSFTKMQDRYSEILNTQLIRRGLLPDQNLLKAEDRLEINNLFSESFADVQWLRFIDSGGEKILFSSYAPDVQAQDDPSLSYISYNEPHLPYEKIAVKNKEPPKYTFDENSGRVFFSFPLYDLNDIYRGTALFSLSSNAVTGHLLSEEKTRLNQDVSVFSNPPGLLFGVPVSSEAALFSRISSTWEEGGQKITKLVSPASGLSMVLISARTSPGFFVGQLVNEEVFSLPQTMKIILLASFFFTVFLIVFLLFNIKQDPVTVVENRVKKLQISLIEQFYEQKSEADWSRWIKELERRREEIIVPLKQGVKTDQGRDSEKLDALINKSWDELLSILGGRRESGVDEEKLRSVIDNIIVSKIALTQASGVQPQPAIAVSKSTEKSGLLKKAETIARKTDNVEEIEELEEVEILEALDDEEAAAEDPSFGPYSGISQTDIATLASLIEFNPDIGSEAAGDESIEEDLEIISPFSTMDFSFSENNEDTADITGDEIPETIFPEANGNRGLPLINASAFGMTGKPESEALETLNEEKEEPSTNNGIIKEREGVHYISEEALEPETYTVKDKNFKDLVDSIIK
jgi:hypothetical protein